MHAGVVVKMGNNAVAMLYTYRGRLFVQVDVAGNWMAPAYVQIEEGLSQDPYSACEGTREDLPCPPALDAVSPTHDRDYWQVHQISFVVGRAAQARDQ